MHFTSLVHQATARVRPRSMQFDASPVVLDPKNRRAASRDGAYRQPPTGARTSSLPSGHTRYYTDTVTPIRHHRSLLHVERAPRLPIAMPLSYGELYPRAPEPVTDQKKPPLRMPFDSQAPHAPDTGFLQH
jgi:septin 7